MEEMIRMGDAKAAKEWLARTASSPMFVENGRLAIQLACRHGHVGVLQALLGWQSETDGAVFDPNDLQLSAICVASMYGHVDVVKVLLAWRHDKGSVVATVDPTVQHDFALRVAAKYGHVQVVKALLEWRRESDGRMVDPTAQGNDAICEAAGNGHVEVVKVLLDWRREEEDCTLRVDPAVQGNWALRMAALFGFGDTVKVLCACDRVDPRACWRDRHSLKPHIVQLCMEACVARHEWSPLRHAWLAACYSYRTCGLIQLF